MLFDSQPSSSSVCFRSGVIFVLILLQAAAAAGSFRMVVSRWLPYICDSREICTRCFFVERVVQHDYVLWCDNAVI